MRKTKTQNYGKGICSTRLRFPAENNSFQSECAAFVISKSMFSIRNTAGAFLPGCITSNKNVSGIRSWVAYSWASKNRNCSLKNGLVLENKVNRKTRSKIIKIVNANTAGFGHTYMLNCIFKGGSAWCHLDSQPGRISRPGLGPQATFFRAKGLARA